MRSLRARRSLTASQAIQHIDSYPKLTSRILNALKTGGISALDSLLDHPAASFVIAAKEDWQGSKGIVVSNKNETFFRLKAFHSKKRLSHSKLK